MADESDGQNTNESDYRNPKSAGEEGVTIGSLDIHFTYNIDVFHGVCGVKANGETGNRQIVHL
ncbi:hypothetical protein [Paenibacillus sp. 481]|uniref:hypothetical protein n=1 Tax=Paenibacillus sp. 481 TaxID=2835869 RepID=UPI001E2BE988|nr:hypothetical protein [Paenibacillus sp. 481]